MRLIFVILVAFVGFVCILLFASTVATFPFRRTIDRNIKFARLFWAVIKLWRNDDFLRNLDDVDRYDTNKLFVDDALMEKEYFAKHPNDRPFRDCVDSAMSFVSNTSSLSSLFSSSSSSSIYRNWWNRCLTTRTRNVSDD